MAANLNQTCLGAIPVEGIELKAGKSRVESLTSPRQEKVKLLISHPERVEITMERLNVTVSYFIRIRFF